MKNKLKYLKVIIALLVLAGCSTNVKETSVINEYMETEQEPLIDTAVVTLKFYQTFNLPDTVTLKITKVISGPETGKYELLMEMQAIREQIKNWNNEIKDLKFYMNNAWYDDSWDADIEDHADASAHINDLMLAYDERAERLLIGDFEKAGNFYEAKTAGSVFWILEKSEGSVFCTRR